jgi:hypothetical protein
MLKGSLTVAGLVIACMLGAATARAFPGSGGIGGGGFGGGIGGVHGGGVPGVIGLGGVPAANAVSGLGPVFAMPQRFRDLNVAGRVGMSETQIVAHGPIVRLRLDGRDIPMQLDTELQSAALQFDPNENYARDLYQSILTKRIEVVGRQDLRDEITRAADESKPLQVEGYVFDRTSPYLVVKSVQAE